MNVHINKFSHFQTWENKKIFDDYPLHIKSGKFTITLLFRDRESIEKVSGLLNSMLFEIEEENMLDSVKNEEFDVPF